MRNKLRQKSADKTRALVLCHTVPCNNLLVSLNELKIELLVTNLKVIWMLEYKNLGMVSSIKYIPLPDLEKYVSCLERNDYIACLIESSDVLIPIANKFNLEKGINVTPLPSARLCTDKYKMREHLAKSSGFREKLYKMPEYSKHALDLVGIPHVICKPVTSTGSYGVRLVAGTSLANIVAEDEIYEQFMPWQQFDVEGLAYNGEVYFVNIIEENYLSRSIDFKPNWFLFSPSLTECLQRRILTAVRGIVLDSGIIFGPFHCEVKYHNNDVFLIEISNRVGSGFNSIMKHSTGNDLTKCYVDTILGKELNMQSCIGASVFVKYIKNKEEKRKLLAYCLDNGLVHFHPREFPRNCIAVQTLSIVHEGALKRMFTYDHSEIGVNLNE